jgi:hypothetical protein
MRRLLMFVRLEADMYVPHRPKTTDATDSECASITVPPPFFLLPLTLVGRALIISKTYPFPRSQDQ